MSISACPAVPTSWCCISTSMPHWIRFGDHLRAQVGVVVHRRYREVAALVPGLVGEVAAGLVLAGVPRAFERVDVVVALVRGGGEARRVEDVELRLRTEERGIPDPGAAQVILGLTGDVARVPAVPRPGQRIMHEKRQVQRLVRPERIHIRRGRVRQQLHIRLVDLLEPRIDEPSNISPSLNTPSPNDPAGTVKCCIVPGRSQNLTSTNSTLSSAMKRRTSSALLNITVLFLVYLPC